MTSFTAGAFLPPYTTIWMEGMRVFYEFEGSHGGGYTRASAVLSSVPEPETYALMMAGLVGIGAMVRRSRGAGNNG